MKHVLHSLGGGVIAAIGLILGAAPASADVLINLGTSNVATSYTYPTGVEPGVLALSDTGLGIIATFDDQSQSTIDNVALNLSIEFLSEVGDPSDDFAHGLFGGGIITMTTTAPEGPGVTIFEATLTGFELTEVVPGAFAGSGAFTNAVYGGDLSNVTMPAEGDLLTSLFEWRTGDINGPIVDIDNFQTAPAGGSTVFADMENLNIVPEPTTLAALALLACAATRKRRPQ